MMVNRGQAAKRSALLSIGVLIVVVSGCSLSPQAREGRHLEAGKSFVIKRDYPRAILEFRNAVQIMPKDPEARFQLGLAAADSGDFASAIAGYRAALALNPKHAGAQLRLAQLMAATPSQDLLHESQSRLVGLLTDPSVSTSALNTLALTELKLGQIDSALDHLQQVLKESPANLISSVLMAQGKLSQNDPNGAEAILKQACAAAPNSVDPVIVLGTFYASQKRPSDAERQFRRALEIDPQSAPARLHLAIVLAELSKKPEAEENLKKLSKVPAQQFKSEYALFLFQEGRRDEAVREFERLAQEAPSDRLVRTRLIVAYQAVGRAADTEKVLAAALKRNPKDLDALLQRAEVFLRAQKYPQAEADLNQVFRFQRDSAEAHYIMSMVRQGMGDKFLYRLELTETVRLNQYLIMARLELAQALLDNRSAQAALELLNQTPASQRGRSAVIAKRNWALWAVGDMPAMRQGIDDGLKQARLPDFLIQDGVWKLRKGDFSAARKSLEDALQIDPDDVRAMTALRESYALQKQLPMAIQKVKEYSAKHPNSAPIQQFLGSLLLVSGDRAQARNALNTAKAADPQYRRTDFSLVQLDVAEAKWEDARKRLDLLAAANRTDPRPQLWLGILEQSRGNDQAAIQHYRDTLTIDTSNPKAMNNLAWSLAQQPNRVDEALKYAEKAVELVPDDASNIDTLGWVLYRKGLYQQSVGHLERAVKGKAPSDREAAVWQYHLAMAYAKAGNAKRGRSAFDAGFKLGPNLPEAKTARELLNIPLPGADTKK